MSLSLWTRLFNWRQLRRTPQPPVVVLSLSSTSASVAQGGTVVIDLSARRAASVNDVTFAVTGLPTGVTGVISNVSPQNANLVTATLTLLASGGASVVTNDAFAVTATLTGANVSTVNATVSVTATVPDGITLTASVSTTISRQQGSTYDIPLVLARTGSFTGTVALAVTGLPTDVTGSFSDSSLTSGETTSTLTLTIDPAAPTVSLDAFTITASGSGVTDATVAGTVTVTTASDFPAGAIWSEDFDNYANTAALQAEFSSSAGKKYQETVPSDRPNASIDTVVTYNGKKTMKYIQGPQVTSGGIPQTGFYFKNASNVTQYYDGIWLRLKVKFSVGWTTNGSGGGAPSYKWLAFFLSGPDASRAMVIHQMGTWAPELIVDDGSLLGGPAISRPGGAAPETTDGNWYDVIVHAKRYSATRGRLRFWFAIDGTTPVLQLDLDGNPNPSVAMGRFFGFSFGRNFNKQPTVANQQINWGPAAIYDDAVYPDPFNIGG